MQSANNPQKWEVWWAKVKFEDEPDVVKTRPVVIFDNRQAYIVSFKVTGQMPRENFRGEYVLQKWQEAGLQTVSVVRLSKQLKLVPDDFVDKIGMLTIKDIMGIKMMLMGFR